MAFAAALFLIKKAENSKNRFTSRVLCIAAIAIPSWLAGCRAEGIGYDTKLYGVVAYEFSLQHSARELILEYSGDSPAFWVLWHFFSSVFRDIFAPQFAVEFIIEFCVLTALKKTEEEDETFHVWIGMAVYYFVFYSYSLNIMRQSLALAIVLVGYQAYLRKGKYVKFALLSACTMAVHTTALFGLVVLVIDMVYEKYFSETLAKRYGFLVLALSASGLFLLSYRSILSRIAAIFPRFLHYLSTSIHFQSTMSALSMFVMIVAFIFAVKMILLRGSSEMNFYYDLLILGIPLFLTNLYSNDTYRLSFYFFYVMILTMPDAFSHVTEFDEIQASNASILRIALLVVLLLFWYMMFDRWGTNDIIPYIFK
ncbi:MAG: EpsG family protein [Lachnospiraceae bacterium]|nr:EpsG family protein [Lachnospiraceae bacterium]